MPNQKLVKFIKEARKRGFEDFQIREPLIKKGWAAKEVEEVFNFLREKQSSEINKSKNKITLFVDDEVLNAIEKRAKRNMFTLNEQIEDILRRSCINLKKQKSLADEKLDDSFIRLFSRRNSGRQRG